MADHFQYRHGQLHAEEVPVERIVRQTGTPVYVYSAATFRDHYQRTAGAFAELDPVVCYSVKGCSNLHVLRLLASWGSGFDVVSGGELYRVLQAGGRADRTVYAGVGKTDDEIRQALHAGIACFNVESEAELENLITIGSAWRRRVNAALRLNPDVDPKTHRHTATGKKESKFGVDVERALNVFERFGREKALRLAGVHVHIGSPVNATAPYVEAVTRTLDFIAALRARGFTIDTLDVGGGFGADYTVDQAPAAEEYAAAIVPLLRGRGLRLILEPGRSISGNAGVLLTQVLYVKAGGDKQFVIVDAAMNDLIRPVLYDAFHFIWPAVVSDDYLVIDRRDPMPLPGLQPVDVVGPICETGDCLAKDRLLPPVQRGDLLAVFTAGAYGFAMSSNYNSRPRAAEVLVAGDSFRLIRRRETYDDLVAPERID